MNDLHRSEFVMHLREMAAKARWILLAAALVGGLVLVSRLAAGPQYEATATVRVALVDAQHDDGAITEFRTRSLAERAMTSGVLAAVADRLDRDLQPIEVRRRLDVDVRDTPGFLTVSARAPEAQEAADWANAMAAAIAETGRLAADGADGVPTADAVVVETIELAEAEQAERVNGLGASLALATLAGLVTAIVVGEALVGLRLLRGRFSPVNAAAEVASLVGAPVHDAQAGPQVNPLLPFYVENLERRGALTVIQFGPRPSIDVACALARVAGEVKSRVLLVDVDGGRPLLPRVFDDEAVLDDAAGFDHDAGPGLAEVLAGQASLRDALRPATPALPAAVLTAGQARPGSTTIAVAAPAVREVLSRSGADQIVLSATAASSLDEVLSVARAFPETVVLVFNPHAVGVRVVRQRIEQLHRVGASIAAVVLEGAPHEGSPPR